MIYRWEECMCGKSFRNKTLVLLMGITAVFASSAAHGEIPVDRAIEKAITFLHDNQMAHGEFRTYATSDSTLQRLLHFDSSPFVTSFVLYSLAFLDDPRADEITKKGLDFLTSEEDGAGEWRYWTSLNDKYIDADLDDMACISFLLTRHGRRFGDNRETFYRNRDGNGIFKTWIRDPNSTNPNDVDCVVNANVLLYLGENSRTGEACRFLTRVIREDTEIENSVYYVDDTAVYYMTSRALNEGVACLESVRDTMIARLIERQEEDGSFGDELATGFALCTFFNCDAYPDSIIEEGIDYLVDTQTFRGSWPASAFYAAKDDGVFWGSQEFTTAICLEALVRYRTAFSREE